MSIQARQGKVVVFSVGKNEYAVPIEVVREVVPWVQPTPIPEAPSSVEGVIDLRGQVIPVIDLARRFGTAGTTTTTDARIMIMDVSGRQAGVVVDEVTEVHQINETVVTPPSPLLQQSQGDPIVAGILKMGEGRLVVLVDAAAIIAHRLPGE